MTKYLYQQYQHEWNHQYSFPTNLVSSVKDSKLALCLRYQFYNENVFVTLKWSNILCKYFILKVLSNKSYPPKKGSNLLLL